MSCHSRGGAPGTTAAGMQNVGGGGASAGPEVRADGADQTGPQGSQTLTVRPLRPALPTPTHGPRNRCMGAPKSGGMSTVIA